MSERARRAEITKQGPTILPRAALVMGVFGGVAMGIAGGYVSGSSYEEKVELLPTCEEVLDRGETLLPVRREQLSETIGRTAVCRMGEETFKIVLPRQ